ncbi:serine/threonine protein kinase [bacterium]|nr:serine/threonine protein kinase [bacterium]
MTTLKQTLGTRAPPALAIVAGDDERELENAYDAGARDVLARPVPVALLRVKALRYASRDRHSPRRIGDYEVVRVLGRGGTGTVYLAMRGALPVALKVLDVRDAEPETLARCRREADLLRALTCREIPRFVDAGRLQDDVFFAMEFVPGETLHALAARGPLPEPLVARVLGDVARALATIHAAGLVHRDVKPANIIVPPAGPAKLVDFGIAKLMSDRTLTRGDVIVGTTPYLAPELFAGEEADTATDAFALGMTGLEALLGRCPLEGSRFSIASRLLRGDVPDPVQLLPHADRRLVAMIEGLLARERRVRHGIAHARAALAAISRCPREEARERASHLPRGSSRG